MLKRDGEGRKDKGGGEGSRSKNSSVGQSCMFVCMYVCMHVCMYILKGRTTNLLTARMRDVFSTSGGGGVCVMKTERYLAT